MKKRILSLLLAAAMLLTLLPTTLLSVSAASISCYISGADLYVDVPVAGLPLNKKNDVEIGALYRNAEGTWVISDPMEVASIEQIVWYEVNGSQYTKLSDGTKAQLGKTYYVSVMFKSRKSEYPLSPSIENHRYNAINGEKPDDVQIWTGSDVTYVEFTKTYECIPASKTTPTVMLKDLELTPYEGNPMEVKIEVKGGTNVRYQWQFIYGDDPDDPGLLEWSGAVDAADGYCYQGCRTPHFKLHGGFGDTFDEATFLSVRCKVTSDNGTVYSQPVWYTILDREVITEKAAISGLTVPTAGKTPDMTVTAGNTAKYTVSNVTWMGPKTADGSYVTKLLSSDKFTAGTYKCRITVRPTDAYKFGEDATATVNGTAASFVTKDGWDSFPFGPDYYFVEKEFTVAPADKTVGGLYVTANPPIAGTSPDYTHTVSGDGFEVIDSYWTAYDEEIDEYLVVRGSFKEGETYRLEVDVKAKSGYQFESNASDMAAYINGEKASILYGHSTQYTTFYKEFTAITPQFTVQPEGGKATYQNKRTIMWETNFKPVKQSLITTDIFGTTVIKVVDPLENSVSASVSDFAQAIRVYYSDTSYIQSDLFYVSSAMDVYFTADSRQEIGGTMTVDIERVVEQSDEWMEGYFEDAITYQWYRDGEAISGATGASYTFTDGDVGHQFYVNLCCGTKSLRSEKFSLNEAEGMRGDVDLDGYVNTLDVLALFDGVSGVTVLTAAQRTKADMDGDGSITTLDVVALFNLVAGIE